MAARGELWVGDLLRAWKQLADGQAPGASALRTAIADTLGLGTLAAPAAARRSSGVADDDVDHLPVNDTGASRAIDEPSPPEPQPLALPPVSDTRSLRPLTPIGRSPLRLPVEADDSLQALPLESGVSAEALPFDPLIDPARARETVGAAIALRRAGKTIDVARLVDAVARGAPPARLPYRATWSPRAGVQVLLDGGEGMTPFFDDQLWLIRQLARNVGAELMRVYRYHGNPLRGVRELPRQRYAPPAYPASPRPQRAPPLLAYAPPPPGTPVLVLGDLGLGRGDESAGLPDWSAWAQQLATRRCPPLVLLPWSPAHWPKLPRCLALAYWDRSLGLGALRQKRRPT
ncbi:MAG: hypothetical protein JSR69_06930 [Proteobacteria bacterium]|nr:hypothetical protein [Pseudomonadota bacterium]